MVGFLIIFIKRDVKVIWKRLFKLFIGWDRV
jgi:hypothetical protein